MFRANTPIRSLSPRTYGARSWHGLGGVHVRARESCFSHYNDTHVGQADDDLDHLDPNLSLRDVVQDLHINSINGTDPTQET